ncbi:MAG TPA: glycosyltransferase family 9 protein [Candidatus Tumulicola sp.]|jgi:ADP-heptose:LPS heptosyltransferase
MSRALLSCAGGGLGDALVASVVARALHQRYDTVDALALPSQAELLARVPDVDGIVVDDGTAESELVRTIVERNYDACVVTWATAHNARVPAAARIPVRVGQARRLYSFRFTKRVVVRSENGDVTSHWSDILLDYARAIGCDAADRRYRFVPTPDDEREALGALDAIGVPRDARGEFLIVNPCNAISSQRPVWPLDGWAALIDGLRRRYRLPIAITGSRSDAPLTESLAGRAGRDGSPVVSLAGTLGIGAFGALARRARAFAGITTGSMHVAAAVDCPTVGIFPFQTDFPDRWAPLAPETAIVRPSYPCHRGDTKERCRDYACVANLDVARILAATQTIA